MLTRLAYRITTMPLKWLITLFISASTLLLLIMLLVFYYSFYRASLETSYDYMDKTLEESAAHIDSLLNEVSSSMLELAYGDDEYWKFVSMSPAQRINTAKVINVMLNRLSDSNSLIIGIALRLKNGSTLFSDNAANTVGTYLIFNDIAREYALSEPFRDLLFTRCYKDASTGQAYFACLVPIYNTTGGARSADRYAGAYIALCATRGLDTAEESALSITQPVIVVSENGTPIFSNNVALAPGLVQAATDGGWRGSALRVDKTVYQARIDTVDVTGWNLLCAVPDSELHKELNQIRKWGYILTASVVLVQLLMGYTLRKSIVRPLSSIVTQIHGVSSAESTVELTMPAGSEIGILAEDIRDMLARIDRMNAHVMETTRALYQAQNDRLEARIMFLQAQINPHFLYNNLACIRGMAATGHMAAVRSMVSAIAAMYRYCASEGQIVTLQEELDVARQFFSIIELRYSSRYSMSVIVDEELLNRPIPKMTLQPILENTFIHGLAGIEKGGRVVIEGHMGTDGETMLSVCDNGHGMSDERMAELNRILAEIGPGVSSEDGEARIGIHNVNSRIRLIFGVQYGIRLYTNNPRGLCVVICFGKSISKFNALLKSQPTVQSE